MSPNQNTVKVVFPDDRDDQEYQVDGFGISPNGDLILVKEPGGKNVFAFAAGTWERIETIYRAVYTDPQSGKQFDVPNKPQPGGN